MYTNTLRVTLQHTMDNVVSRYVLTHEAELESVTDSQMCITQCVLHDNPGAAWSASEQHTGFRAYTPKQLKLSQAKL